jgi:hypothetical protein
MDKLILEGIFIGIMELAFIGFMVYKIYKKSKE